VWESLAVLHETPYSGLPPAGALHNNPKLSIELMSLYR
jgi:hypothetical protein